MRASLVLLAAVACTPLDEGEPTTRRDDPIATVAPPPDDCDALGLSKVAWNTGPSGETLEAIAGDFTVKTLDGPWTLSEHFSGCDSYLFIPSVQDDEPPWPEPLWSRDGEDLFARLPPNVHLFFVSNESGDDFAAELDLIQATVDAGLDSLKKADRDHWADRVHIVKMPLSDLNDDSWVGRYLDEPGWGFGIDRSQRIRNIGSLADGERYSPSFGWFAPNLSHVAYEAVRYNAEALRDAHLAADGATVVRPFSAQIVEDSGWAGVMGYNYLELPSALEMAAFDTLELDFTLDCPGPGEYGVCPAWDRIVNGYLCDAANEDQCTLEFGRWISAYHRKGRWVTDASFLLPLLAEGGTRRLALYSIDPYAMTLDFRLSNQGKSEAPSRTEQLWQVFRAMDDGYLPAFPERAVTIPADSTRTELTVVISGHGMSSGQNCAEFCDTHHILSVNGVPAWEISFAQTDDPEACQNDVANGTVPNQYGTWFYGRSNWCPGKAVVPLTFDVSGLVTPGEPAVFSYTATGPTGPLPGGQASMDVSVFVTDYAAR